jgi:hypothetical protein
MRFSSGRREVTLKAGDICLLDMGPPNRTVLRGGGGRTHLRAIILQRAMLAPRLAHPDAPIRMRRRRCCCRRTIPMPDCSTTILRR